MKIGILAATTAIYYLIVITCQHAVVTPSRCDAMLYTAITSSPLTFSPAGTQLGIQILLLFSHQESHHLAINLAFSDLLLGT